MAWLCRKIKDNAVKIFGLASGAVASWLALVWLVVTSTWVTLESADISTLNDANTAYLSTVFQVVQLLPYIAVMAGWFFLINKLFSIIPTGGSR